MKPKNKAMPAQSIRRHNLQNKFSLVRQLEINSGGYSITGHFLVLPNVRRGQVILTSEYLGEMK